MKRACSIVLALSLVILLAGCKPSAANTDNEIRIAIEAHLAHKGTLNLKAFDTVMKQVTLKGDHAQAQVEFHVKNGGGSATPNPPPGHLPMTRNPQSAPQYPPSQ